MLGHAQHCSYACVHTNAWLAQLRSRLRRGSMAGRSRKTCLVGFSTGVVPENLHLGLISSVGFSSDPHASAKC